jgi:hypothetical protein
LKKQRTVKITKKPTPIAPPEIVIEKTVITPLPEQKQSLFQKTLSFFKKKK